MSRQKTTINIVELANSILGISGIMGGFQNKSQIVQKVSKLAYLVPEFIQIKNVVIKGQ